MGQINITDIDSNSKATANSINTRIGKIVTLLNGNLDAANIAPASLTKSLMAADVYGAIYPIGSVYINAQDSTNPATLFGFGTWEAFGAGRVMVGIDATQTEFDSVGETGGEKTHVLIESELASHTHANAAHAHTYYLSQNWAVPTGSGNFVQDTSAYANQAKSTSASTIAISNTGGNAAHNNLQPYITVYCWKRVG